MPLPSRSEFSRERLPPVSCARMRERIGAACHLRMSPSIGRAPFPANQSRRVRHLIWIPTQRLRDTRCHHRAPLRAPHQDQPMPRAASPLLEIDQKPDPASSRPSCACASYGARFLGLTSDQHRCVCSSSPSRARCCYHARGFEAFRPVPVRRPEEEVTPLSALPCRRDLRLRHERWSRFSCWLAPQGALDPNPGGSARSLMSRPDIVRTFRHSKSSPNLRRRGLPGVGSEDGRLPWGFLPFGACGGGQRLVPGLPPPATRRPRAFSAPRRFAPPISCPALFHAGSTLGLAAFRGFPSPVAGCASRRDLPLMPFDIDRFRHRPGRAEVRSQLQGFEHLESPFPMGRRYPVSVGSILS
jgi:hypothetical protein